MNELPGIMGQKSYTTMISISCGMDYITFTLHYMGSEFQGTKHDDLQIEETFDSHH